MPAPLPYSAYNQFAIFIRRGFDDIFITVAIGAKWRVSETETAFPLRGRPDSFPVVVMPISWGHLEMYFDLLFSIAVFVGHNSTLMFLAECYWS